MLCFVCSRIFGLVCFKLHSTGRYSCITAPQLLLYSQHWTRLANIQTNTQAKLELPKQGLQSFFEGHPYNLKQNFPWQTCREWFIKLCACGPDFAALNEYPVIVSTGYEPCHQPLSGGQTVCPPQHILLLFCFCCSEAAHEQVWFSFSGSHSDILATLSHGICIH